MALLIKNDDMSFKLLKKELELSDGNLSSHLAKLDEKKYIIIVKTKKDNRPHTSISISQKGKEDFKTYISQLKQFIKDNE